MRWIVSVVALALFVALGLFWAASGFDRLAEWAAGHQRAFQNTMALSLRAARAQEPGAVLTLLGACFAYGLAHAAGPGHGKILIGGYGLGRKVPMLRLSGIALLASLGQAVTAVALVYAGVWLFALGRKALVGAAEDLMAPVSYGAIALVGLWLMLRGARRFMARKQGHGHSHDHKEGPDGTCASCGHVHGPTLEQVESARDLRTIAALIGGIALRPCTGAVFVLIITWQMGIAGLGIAGAFAMALGTGLVTIAVGLAASGMRGGLLAAVSDRPALAQFAAGLEVLAGLAVLVLASGLLLRAL